MTTGKCQGTFRMLNKNLKWQWLTGTAQVVFKGNEPDFIITTNRPLRWVLYNFYSEERLSSWGYLVPMTPMYKFFLLHNLTLHNADEVQAIQLKYWFFVSNFAPSFGIFNTWDWESQRASFLAEHYLSKCYLGTVCSDEEGEEILRQRGQFPALPFTASDCGSPSPRSPGSPASIGSYRNGGSPQAIPWDRFSVKMDTFKFPNMPTKYPNSNGRVKKKQSPQISDDIAKSPASGKCFPFLA